MYLSTLRLWNFRKYCAMADGKPGLEIHFQEGVNVLIGENDSGKTELRDATGTTLSGMYAIMYRLILLIWLKDASNSTTKILPRNNSRRN